MPRVIDPASLGVGGGHVYPGSVDQGLPPPVTQPVATATIATTVGIADPYSRYFLGHSVQGGFDELAALVPPGMGGVGSDGVPWLGSTNTGVPDWGVLKLRDGSLVPTGNPLADVHGVYPYYYRSPVCPSGSGVIGTGLDPITDPTFNYYDSVGYPLYTGCGDGIAHAGFTTVSMDGNPPDGYPTWRLIPAIVDPAVVVSGIVSPADRGVLALVTWPTGDLTAPPVPAASAAAVLTRCVAAVLLGRGAEAGGCDGSSGGAFVEGSGSSRAVGSIDFTANPVVGYNVTVDLTALGLPTAICLSVAAPPTNALEFLRSAIPATTALNFARALNEVFYPQTLVAVPSGAVVTITLAEPGTLGNSVVLSTSGAGLVLVQPVGGTDTTASPYTFPGRASGQYNLSEIHSGVSITGGAKPFLNPAAGQVRLLTDPAAFPTVSPSTLAGGIPILGGTSISVGAGAATYLPFGLGGGTDGNFFAYRLPYLKDYSVATGLPYTGASEKSRFTTKIGPATPGSLTQAGDYDNFTTDFWAFQVARYRHRFDIAAGATGALRPDGSYALVHFKKEVYFEAYVRDGLAVTDDQVYSVNLVSWSGSAQVDNLVTLTSPTTVASPYSTQQSEINEDPLGATAPALVAGSKYTLATLGTTTWYSGIEYYVPRDRTVLNAPAFGLRSFFVTLSGVWNTSYRSHDKIPAAGPLSGDPRGYALNMNPAFLSLGSYSYEGTESPVTSTITLGSLNLFPGSLGEIRRQRVEFGYADLTTGTTNPVFGDPATISAAGALADGVTFLGDTTSPVFTQDAKVRLFVRRPLTDYGVPGTGYGYPMPYSGGNTTFNRGFTIPEAVGKTILYHSMKETSLGIETVLYGNPSNTGKVVFNSTKDTSERFLDETYRYPANWSPLAVPADLAQLVGPGLPGGVASVGVPVRPIVGDPSYPGWFFQGWNADPTKITGLQELQVAGLPARNPDYTEGVTEPFPSRGLLTYPQKNYTGYSPAGTDYSVLIGDREYVRAFDGGAANVGASTINLKLWGLDLTDFAYAPAGPGGVGVAVMVKIPGVTTWMDVGRADGGGPSKQDIALDGAGCQVVGPDTFSGTDTTTQLRYSQVKVNLGPIGALFLNAEVPARCPILVKVILKDNVTGKGLNFEQGGEDGPTSSCRGLVGIELL